MRKLTFAVLGTLLIGGCSGTNGDGSLTEGGTTTQDASDAHGFLLDGSLGGDTSVDSNAPTDGRGNDAPATQSDSKPGYNPDAPLSPENSCAASTYTTARLPPAFNIVIDRSGSMADAPDDSNLPFGDPGSKWALTTTALMSLITGMDDNSVVGLTFFPAPGLGNEDSASVLCKDSTYSKPDVNFARLVDNRPSIGCWLGKNNAACATDTNRHYQEARGTSQLYDQPPMWPAGWTPMRAAVAGGVTALRTPKLGLASPPPYGQLTLILFTDGDPKPTTSPCGGVTDVARAASTGAFGTAPNVTTYVIGAPGGSVANLSRIAYSGNGRRIETCLPDTSDPAKACHYQIGATNFQADLLAAFKDIAAKAISCSFSTPRPTATGTAVNAEGAQVYLTSGATKALVSRDGTHTNGWDYTDGGTKVTLYGAACNSVKKDANASVQVLVPCQVTPPPDAGTPPPDTTPACIASGQRCGQGTECCAPNVCMLDQAGEFRCFDSIQ